MIKFFVCIVLPIILSTSIYLIANLYVDFGPSKSVPGIYGDVVPDDDPRILATEFIIFLIIAFRYRKFGISGAATALFWMTLWIWTLAANHWHDPLRIVHPI